MSKKSNFKEVLKSVYKDYIQSFLELKNEFKVIIDYLVRLDFLLARVHVSKIYNYCKPTIDNSAINHSLMPRISDIH